jgi:phenylalanyl-tRNA synthetase alpha chain
MPSYLSAAELTAALTLRDLSDPDHGQHAMQILLGDVVRGLTRLWDIPADIIRQSPLVSVADNYDELGFDLADVTRDQRYSRYISPTVMLRSHTSASVPAILRSLPNRAEYDRLSVLPGLVYRRDVIDRTHVGAPHQVDLWRLRAAPDLTHCELEAMISTVVEAVLPGARWRVVPAAHPYTVQGRQIDVLLGSDWLELGECGLVSPRIMRSAGMDAQRWSGLALGLGLDRALMLRKQLPDIRLLRAADARISRQMLDLSRWRPVSTLPAVRRDISVVVDADADGETLGDKARAALGDRVDDLESVKVLALNPYSELPEGARTRLRLRDDQANALIRVTLRPLSRTLTDKEANEFRNEIYSALHEGSVAELIES